MPVRDYFNFKISVYFKYIHHNNILYCRHWSPGGTRIFTSQLADLYLDILFKCTNTQISSAVGTVILDVYDKNTLVSAIILNVLLITEFFFSSNNCELFLYRFQMTFWEGYTFHLTWQTFIVKTIFLWYVYVCMYRHVLMGINKNINLHDNGVTMYQFLFYKCYLC